VRRLHPFIEGEAIWGKGPATGLISLRPGKKGKRFSGKRKKAFGQTFNSSRKQK